MRRKDKEMSLEKSIHLLETGEFGTLATASETGEPYATPLNYVYANSFIYFHGTSENGRKMENIKKNRNVCFNVVGNTKVLSASFNMAFQSVTVDGRVSRLKETEKKDALLLILKKYSNDYLEPGLKYIEASLEKVDVFKIEPVCISGKEKTC